MLNDPTRSAEGTPISSLATPRSRRTFCGTIAGLLPSGVDGVIRG